MNKDLAKIFGLSIALTVLVSCSNVASTNHTSTSQSITVANAPAVAVNWSKVEATADKLYQNHPYSNKLSVDKRAAQFYANDFGVPLAEAERRLLIQGYSSELLQAIEQELKDNVVASILLTMIQKNFELV